MNDRATVALAVVVAAAAFAAPPVPPALALLFVALWAVLRRPALLAVALVLVVGGRASDSLAALAAPLPERVSGRAELASDPEQQRFGVRFVVRVDGRRYLAEVPTERAAPVRSMLTGEWVQVTGRPRPLRGAPPGWVRSQHLAGRLAVSEVAPLGQAPPWYRLANAAHRTLAAGSAPFGERRPLYLGLVIGDDRGQSDLTRFRFEASGLTHLLAVSGSNVAFVLAVVAPVMQRLGRHGRLALAGSLLVLFVLVTRAEPSVLRAAVMAAVALTAVTLGRVAPAVRILAVTISLLLAADPLLVHSLGFQLSVSATAGLITLTRPIAERLPGPVTITGPLAVTIAAQLATAPLLIALNGGLPAVATLANLFAGPAAGAVMMLGVTGGLLAGVLGDTSAGLLQAPTVVLVTWVDLVATTASRLPAPVLGPGRLALLAGAATAAVLARRWWPGGRSARVAPLAGVAMVCALVALWPAAPPAGTHPLVDGAELRVGRCGGRVLVLGGAAGPRPVLQSLWKLGVRRVDVAVVGATRADATVATVLVEQLAVVRSITAAERGPPGIEPLAGRELEVGGLLVRASTTAAAAPTDGVERHPTALIEAVEGRCRLAP